MANLSYDDNLDELMARGGTFDLTGTIAITEQQFWGFNASDGAVLEVLKGVPVKTLVSTLAGITAAEVDLADVIFTALTDPLFAGVIYRADGYIITKIKLTSGSLHLYKTQAQITA